MKLIRLGIGKYEVLAVCDDRKGNCPVLEFLRRADAKLRVRMLMRLERKIPENGPEWSNDRRCKKLKPHVDEICEFKERPGRGAGMRILFFCEPGNQLILVCTDGFTKTDKINETALSRAKKIRKQYLMEMHSGTLEIYDMADHLIETRGPDNGKLRAVH